MDVYKDLARPHHWLAPMARGREQDRYEDRTNSFQAPVAVPSDCMQIFTNKIKIEMLSYIFVLHTSIHTILVSCNKYHVVCFLSTVNLRWIMSTATWDHESLTLCHFFIAEVIKLSFGNSLNYVHNWSHARTTGHIPFWRTTTFEFQACLWFTTTSCNSFFTPFPCDWDRRHNYIVRAIVTTTCCKALQTGRKSIVNAKSQFCRKKEKKKIFDKSQCCTPRRTTSINIVRTS